jgi:hypothetical protein
MLTAPTYNIRLFVNNINDNEKKITYKTKLYFMWKFYI